MIDLEAPEDGAEHREESEEEDGPALPSRAYITIFLCFSFISRYPSGDVG